MNETAGAGLCTSISPPSFFELMLVVAPITGLKGKLKRGEVHGKGTDVIQED